ncbi:hypothetical protein HTG_01250 [Natrinema mahii]|nr:hypothetical protein HTG_01250 [Natrinema mahii]
MTDFERHLQHGISAHALLVAALGIPYLLGALREETLVVALAVVPITLVGSVAPDIDHPHARPYRLATRYVPPATAAVATCLTLKFGGAAITAVESISVGVDPLFVAGASVATVFWVGWWATSRLFPRLRPSHRTVTHRISAGMTVAVCLTTVVVLLLEGTGLPSGLVVRTSALCGGAFLVGFLTHLAGDGLLRDRWRTVSDRYGLGE